MLIYILRIVIIIIINVRSYTKSTQLAYLLLVHVYIYIYVTLYYSIDSTSRYIYLVHLYSSYVILCIHVHTIAYIAACRLYIL